MQLKEMSFYDFFHKFFEDFHNLRPFENDGYNNPMEPPIWDPENDSSNFRSPNKGSEPLQLAKLIEQQFKEMFMIVTEGPGMMQPPGGFPTIEGVDPRDHYLKPEHRDNAHAQPDVAEHTDDAQPKFEHFEQDIGQWSHSVISWLDGMMSAPSLPDKGSPTYGFSSFSRRTVTLSDGTVKTEEIIRNPDGTEKRTETISLPNGISSTDSTDPGFFNFPKMPHTNNIGPRDQYLKPGFEQIAPSDEKSDKDLDKQILLSGIKSLPSFSNEDTIVQQPTDINVVKKRVTLSNGVFETEVVQNSDGTEHTTVTQVFPDGTTKSSLSGPQVLGREGTNERTTYFTLKVVKDLINVLFK